MFKHINNNSNKVAIIIKNNIRIAFFLMVSRAGFEPATHSLKGNCSTN